MNKKIIGWGATTLLALSVCAPCSNIIMENNPVVEAATNKKGTFDTNIGYTDEQLKALIDKALVKVRNKQYDDVLEMKSWDLGYLKNGKRGKKPEKNESATSLVEMKLKDNVKPDSVVAVTFDDSNWLDEQGGPVSLSVPMMTSGYLFLGDKTQENAVDYGKKTPIARAIRYSSENEKHFFIIFSKDIEKYAGQNVHMVGHLHRGIQNPVKLYKDNEQKEKQEFDKSDQLISLDYGVRYNGNKVLDNKSIYVKGSSDSPKVSDKENSIHLFSFGGKSTKPINENDPNKLIVNNGLTLSWLTVKDIQAGDLITININHPDMKGTNIDFSSYKYDQVRHIISSYFRLIAVEPYNKVDDRYGTIHRSATYSDSDINKYFEVVKDELAQDARSRTIQLKVKPEFVKIAGKGYTSISFDRLYLADKTDFTKIKDNYYKYTKGEIPTYEVSQTRNGTPVTLEVNKTDSFNENSYYIAEPKKEEEENPKPDVTPDEPEKPETDPTPAPKPEPKPDVTPQEPNVEEPEVEKPEITEPEENNPKEDTPAPKLEEPKTPPKEQKEKQPKRKENKKPKAQIVNNEEGKSPAKGAFKPTGLTAVGTTLMGLLGSLGVVVSYNKKRK